MDIITSDMLLRETNSNKVEGYRYGQTISAEGTCMDPQRAKLERDALIAPYIETLTRAKNAAPESEDANRLQVIIHAIEMVELETLDRAEHVVNWHLHELEGHLARMATLDNR